MKGLEIYESGSGDPVLVNKSTYLTGFSGFCQECCVEDLFTVRNCVFDWKNYSRAIK